jgi:thioredoxin 1
MNRRDIAGESLYRREEEPASRSVASAAAERYKAEIPEVPMASANVKELTDSNFEAEVLKAELPTLVDFWAVWCGPCKMIAPMVDALADEYQGKLKVAKMDVDRHQIVPQQYSVRSIPTLLLFKNGKVVSQLVGTMPRPKLEAEIKKHL